MNDDEEDITLPYKDYLEMCNAIVFLRNENVRLREEMEDVKRPVNMSFCN